jgi:hypothetical protein
MDAGAAEIAPIVSGVTMTRVTGGDANVSWELDQLEGLKYPNDQAVSPLPPLQDAPPIHLIGWPYVKAPSGDQISADLTLDWQYTGTALGNIRIAATGSHGVPPQTLKVKAHIINDTILHPKEAPHMAGLRVRVHYQFSRTAGSDAVGVTHLHLFGDGTYDQTSRWEQS